MNKLPLGLMPRKMWDEVRKQGIEDAVKRYRDADKTVPWEWIQEHAELSERYDRKQSALEGQEWD
jgi:hypothetical protein